jgi:hypothetical protein
MEHGGLGSIKCRHHFEIRNEKKDVEDHAHWRLETGVRSHVRQYGGTSALISFERPPFVFQESDARQFSFIPYTSFILN